MKIKNIISKIIILLIVSILLIFIFQLYSNARLENEEELLIRVQKENEDNPESTVYLITDKYVINVLPETSIEKLKENIENGIKVYEDNTRKNEVTTGIVKTGMLLEYLENNRTFDISVLGDLNSDGKLNQIELTREIRHILNLKEWKIENEIEILSGDINRNKKIDEKDAEKIIEYIVFDKLETKEFSKVEKPKISVTSGEFNEDRYETNVGIKIAEEQENAEKTIYKVTGSVEREYKEINKTEDLSIEVDGVFKVTAYTYGKDGNKSKGESVIIVREIPTYTVKYSAGTQGIFETQENDKLYIGDDTPQFSGEIVGNPGYKFIGWNEEIKEKVDGSIEYVAKWEPIEYKIEYELDGGVLGEENPTTYNVETENFILNNPSKFGYKFLGWSENESEEIKENITIEKGTIGDKKYTAKWEGQSGIIYHVKIYEMNTEGEYVENITEYRGVTDEVITIDTTAKDGFTYEEELSIPSGIINPNGSTELVIYFSRNKYKLKIIAGNGIKNVSADKYIEEDEKEILESNNKQGALEEIKEPVTTGGNIEDVSTEENNTKITVETENTKLIEKNVYYEEKISISSEVLNGYTWSSYISSNEEVLENINEKETILTMPIGDVELTATSTINTYNISYNLNGGSLLEGEANPTTYTVETEDFILKNPSKQGYTFIGWKKNNEEEIIKNVTVKKGTVGEHVFEAIYESNADTTYTTIIYIMNLNGEYEAKESYTRLGTTDEIAKENIEERTGLTYEPDLSISEGKIAGDGSLKLKLYYSRNRYDLTVEKTNGIVIYEGETGNYYYGEEISLDATAIAGYTWESWKSSNEKLINTVKQREYVFNMPAGNIEMKAEATLNTYTITYDLVGGELEEGKENPTTYTVETEDFTLNAPKKAGYEFLGWTGTDITSPSSVTISKNSIGDREYRAAWKARIDTPYKVSIYKMNIEGEYEVTTTTRTAPTELTINLDTTAEEGFTYESNLSIPSGKIAGDGSTELKIYFSRNKYNLTIKEDGIQEVEGENTYYYEAPVTVKAKPKVGYTWNEWESSNKELVANSPNLEYNFTMPAEDITLTGKATANVYTITYKLNEGEFEEGAIHPEFYTVETERTQISNPKKLGYSFMGWYDNLENSFDGYIYGTLMQNLELNARWIPRTDTKYTATVYKMNINGEYEIESERKGEGKTANYISMDTRAEEGFTYEESISNPSAIVEPDGSTHIYVYYSRNKYRLTPDIGYGIQEVEGGNTYYYEAPVTVNATPKLGYTWNKWESTSVLLSNSNDQTYSFNMPADNVKLIASATLDQYSISYDLDGGILEDGKSNPISYNVETDSFTLNAPIKTGYIFEKWIDSKNVSYTNVTVSKGSTGNLSYTAVWRGNIYELIVNPNRGIWNETTENTIVKSNYGVRATIVPPTREGYTFAGWTLEGVGSVTNTLPLDSTIQSYTFGDGNGIITANWKRNDYTLKIKPNGGNWEGNTNVVEVTQAYLTSKIIEAPTREGYTFVGWALEGAGSITNTLPIETANQTYIFGAGTGTITAKWKVNNYNLTVTAETGGTVSGDKGKVPYGANCTVTATAIDGYTFSGWYVGSTKVCELPNYAFTMPSNDYEIVAKFKVNSYKLVINPTGGTWEGRNVSTEITQEYKTTKLITVPSRKGYSFAGWVLEGAGSITKTTPLETSTQTYTYGAGEGILTATWNVNNYNLTREAEVGGTVEGNSGKIMYETVCRVVATADAGYTFDEWYADGRQVALTEDYTFSMPANDYDLLAKFTANSYTLTINPNGGIWKGTVDKTDIIQQYLTTKIIPAPTKIGYTFTGWTLSGAGSITESTPLDTVDQIFTYGIGDARLTANWKINSYTLTINPNGGTWGGTISNSTVTQNYETNKIIGVPTRTGYTFAGWILEGSGSITSTDPIAISEQTYTYGAGNATITAKWTVNSYTLTINPNGGIWGGTTSNSTATQNYETSKAIAVPTRTGYTFAGWILEGAGSITSTIPIATANQTYIYGAGNAIITAKWNINSYTLTRTAETGGSVSGSSGSINYNASCIVTATASTGYSFAGWYSGGTMVSASASYTFNMPASNYSLVAKFTVNNYTLTRTAERGGNVSGSSGTISYGTSCTVTAVANTGYTFAGWYSGSTNVSTSASYTFNMPASNYSLVAKFTPITYTITYNLGGGSVSTANPTTYTIETTSFTLNNPSKVGCTFAGWTGSNGTSAQKTLTIANGSTGNKTYIANWTVNSYTLTINPNGGTWGGTTANSTATQNYGTSKAIAVPTRIGYTFAGWILEGAGSITSTTPIATANQTYIYGAGNATITAKWNINSYTLTRTAEAGGSVSGSSGSINYNASCTVTATASTGYSFTGWYSGSTMVSASASYTFNMPASNYSLVAKFTPITYTITYDANGGTGAPNPQSKTHGTALKLSTTVPTKTNYIFVGWSTSSSATTATYNAGDNYTVEGDKTLFAVWKINEIKFSNGDWIRVDGPSGTNGISTETTSATIPAGAKITIKGVIQAAGAGVYGQYDIKFNGVSQKFEKKTQADDYQIYFEYTTTTAGTLKMDIEANSCIDNIDIGGGYTQVSAYGSIWIYVDSIVDVETGNTYTLK